MADVTEKLAKLAELFEKGLISREEFDLQKTALLGAGTVGRPTAIGSYRIVEEIGEGGMGVVYRVRHRNEDFAERQGGDVALKVLHAQYARRPEIVERFEREAALGIQLDHPGIVRVHELVVDGGQVALVMECVAGRPLSRMIGSETGPIPWERCRPMFEALVEAVDHAHAHGVIHRDLKPENIMVGPEGRLKILDFGIAKELGTDRTQTGTGMGTIGYMAPEQYTDAKSVDARADVYALGMTVYEMLAGRLPWEPDASDFRILQRKESGDLPPPTAFYPDVPPGVVDVVMRMLAPDPSDRYASCGELLAALDSMVLEVEAPVTPPVVSTGTVIDEAVPKSKKPVAPPSSARRGIVPIILGLLVFLGGGFWLFEMTNADSRRSRGRDYDDDDKNSAEEDERLDHDEEDERLDHDEEDERSEDDDDERADHDEEDEADHRAAISATAGQYHLTESGLGKSVLSCPTGTEVDERQYCLSHLERLGYFGDIRPAADATVTVNYTGWTAENGEEIDSTAGRRPASFELSRVIEGFSQALQTMVVGETARFWIPEHLAYGREEGRPQGPLIFDIELIAFENSPEPDW